MKDPTDCKAVHREHRMEKLAGASEGATPESTGPAKVVAAVATGSPPKCCKCGSDQAMTPVCLCCGTIPISDWDTQKMREENQRMRKLLATLRPRTLILYRNTVRGNEMVPTALTREIDALLANTEVSHGA